MNLDEMRERRVVVGQLVNEYQAKLHAVLYDENFTSESTETPEYKANRHEYKKYIQEMHDLDQEIPEIKAHFTREGDKFYHVRRGWFVEINQWPHTLFEVLDVQKDAILINCPRESCPQRWDLTTFSAHTGKRDRINRYLPFQIVAAYPPVGQVLPEYMEKALENEVWFDQNLVDWADSTNDFDSVDILRKVKDPGYVPDQPNLLRD